MCIRDSVNVDADVPEAKPRSAPNAAKRLKVNALLVDDEAACLLYTSDAADERSSVDLGGRRIIKKKNTV